MTRREVLMRALAAGGLAGARASFAKASQPATPVNFEVPADACDCHTHVFPAPDKFPMWSGRTYTPELATPEEMAALHRALHIRRVVIVTPSVYGTGNAATLYAMKARGGGARGIAVIDRNTPEDGLDAMGKAGIRGIRLNLATAGQAGPDAARQRFQEAAARMASRGWHIQIYAAPAAVAALKDLVLAAPVPVVFDHFGGLQARLGLEQPSFAELVRMLDSGKAYVKLSGAYRASTQAPDYADAAPLARAFLAANPDRVIWGTDWPHPDTAAHPGRAAAEVTPLLPIDDGRLMNQLAVWAPDAGVRRKILVENPARLYGF
jgi:predicted TIM-barrel fold metal-dependent hydrolase